MGYVPILCEDAPSPPQLLKNGAFCGRREIYPDHGSLAIGTSHSFDRKSVNELFLPINLRVKIFSAVTLRMIFRPSGLTEPELSGSCIVMGVLVTLEFASSILTMSPPAKLPAYKNFPSGDLWYAKIPSGSPSDRDAGTYLFGFPALASPKNQSCGQKMLLSRADPVPS